MKRIIFTLSTLFLLSTHLFAEGNEKKETVPAETNTKEAAATYYLEGAIYDASSGEAIPGVSVIIDGVKFYSDLSGKFNISQLHPGAHTVQVNYISYRPQAFEINLKKNEALQIELFQQ